MNTARFHFYEESKTVKLTEAESRTGGTGGWGRGEWGVIL